MRFVAPIKKCLILLPMILLLAAPLRAKKPAPPAETDLLGQAVDVMGGLPKYLRTLTLRYDFEEIFISTDNVSVKTRGRHFLKMHDDNGFRGREEVTSSTSPFVTVFNSSGVWREEGSLIITDPQSLQSFKHEFLRKILLILLPFHAKEANLPVGSLPPARLLGGKLHRRFSIDLKDSALFFPGTRVTLYLDNNAGRPQAVLLEDLSTGKVETLLLSDYALVQNFLELPGKVLLFDESGKIRYILRIQNLLLNSFIDESFFHIPASSEPLNPDAKGDPAP